MEKEELLSIEELCKYLGVGRNTAYALIKNGKIKAFKAGRSWIIPKRAITEYIQLEIEECRKS